MPDDVGVALEKWVGGLKAEDLRGLWSRLESSVFPHTSGPYPVKHEADHVGRVVVNLANLLEAIAREKVAPLFWNNLHILFAAALVHDVGMVSATIDAGENLDEARRRHADLGRIKTMLNLPQTYSPVNAWDEYEHLCALASSHATSTNGDGTETTAETKTKELESRFGQLHPYIGHYSRLLQFADFLDIRRSRLNQLSPQQYRSEQYPHYRKHELLTARVDPKAMLISLEAGTVESDEDRKIVGSTASDVRFQFGMMEELLRYGWKLRVPESIGVEEPKRIPRRVALVVSARWGQVTGRADASRVYAMLIHPDLGACDQQSPTPIHDCGSFGDFENALRAVLSKWDPADQLVFYFAGYGRFREGVFCLRFGASDDDWEPFSNILSRLRTGAVSSALVVLDTWFCGDMSHGTSSAISGDVPAGIAVVAFSSRGESSQQLNDQSGSVFTNLFCSGVETGLDGAPTVDGVIGVEDIVEYVNSKQGSSSVQLTHVGGTERNIWVAQNKSGKAGSRTERTDPGILWTAEELRLAYETTITSRHPCHGASTDDLDWQLVEQYARTAEEPVAQRNKVDTLRRLGMLSPLSARPAPHNAAVLCFAARPERFIPQARSTFLFGDKSSQMLERVDVCGPLSAQIEQLVHLIGSRAHKVDVFGDGAARREETDLPSNLVREVVANAIIHRDYTLNGRVLVHMTQEGLEVHSPGGFPSGVSWEAFLAKKDTGSYPVDAAVALYVTNLLVFEGVGRGFSVMREHLEQHGKSSIACLIQDEPPELTLRIRRGAILQTNTARVSADGVQDSATHLSQYRSSRVEEVSKRLRDLRRRRIEILELGANTEKLDTQILEARRELRNGPIEAGWELSEGRYLLLEELGRGGFATVWKARDRKHGELVATKLIHAHLTGDSVRLERFFRGARIMAELDHPGIVKVLEPHGEDQGYHYFVMELMKGGTLRDAVRTKHLSPDAALDCIIQVGEALAEAHAKGYVHRDVKPANILMTAGNDAKLSDFDLVGAGDTTGGTRTGALGSYAYAAPECMTRPQDANATADVYSLAMTMVFALTGVDPNPWTFKESLSRLPCDGAMKSVLRKATDFEPAKRHSNAGELVRALRERLPNQKPPPNESVAAALNEEVEKSSHIQVRTEHPSRPPWAAAFGIDDKSPYPYAEVEIANGVVTRLRWIPPGRFLMGSPEGEAERRDDEGPRHWVTITRGFWLEETACTQAEWEAVMGSNPSRFKNEPRNAQRPVENMSWNDCQEFLKRVNDANHELEVRFPTEAEWEYACRAGTQTPFSFGENITTDQVNYDGNYPYAGAAKGECRKSTSSVRSLPPNNWGLYEMHGNVWEWCGDWYGGYPAEEQRDPTGPTVGLLRVLRGGGWINDAGYCRSALRSRNSPDKRWHDVGFRLLAVQPGEPE